MRNTPAMVQEFLDSLSNYDAEIQHWASNSGVSDASVDKTVQEITSLVDQRQGGHRIVIHLVGEAAASEPLAAAYVARLGSSSCCWVSWSPPTVPCRWVEMREAEKLLGQEFDVVVLSCHPGLHADALGCCAGLALGGGAFVILTPDWAAQKSKRKPLSPFTARVDKFLRQCPRVVVDDSGVVALEPGSDPGYWARPVPQRTVVPSGFQPVNQGQEAVVARMVEAARGGDRVALLASRGRGKSTALGMAAVALQKAGYPAVITGPEIGAVQAVLAVLGAAKVEAAFVAAGEVDCASLSPGTALLIDEAARIDTDVLRSLLTTHKGPAVLCSTADGYEGNGQMLAKILREVSMNILTLEDPIRWAKGDPFECTVNQCLLLDAQCASVPDDAAEDVDFTKVHRRLLQSDDGLLAQVYSLLKGAHYRTSPSDLRLLLDDTTVELFLARSGDGQHVIAVCMLVHEGVHGLKRHDLISETLKIEQGYRVARVARIAVHPSFQGKGLGARLTAAVVERFKEHSGDIVGVLFRADDRLSVFWSTCGFRTISAREGRARLVVRAISDRSVSAVDVAATRLGE